MGVVGLVGSLGPAMGSLRLFGFIGFVRARPGGRRVRWAHSCGPWWSSGLFGVVGFIRSCLACRRVHSGLLGSLGALPGCGPLHSGSLDKFGPPFGS